MTKKKTSYKDTLNLPKTTFEMRANLLQKEPDMQARWRESRLYEAIRRDRKGLPRFILHDGPPYANGNIHMGTALNKVLKDIVVRIKNMTGQDSPYVPGWDCHGLPIEAKVMEELGDKALAMEPLAIRRICRRYAEKFTALQSEQFQRLGVMGQFDDPYITMHPQYESAVLEVFARLVEQGVVYKQLKPVHWSIENRTALADAELEYKDRQDSSIYVAFEVLSGRCEGVKKTLGEGEKLSLLIWTTTPWTLPGNLAVAVHPDMKYQSVRLETADGARCLLIAADRVEPVLETVRNRREGWLKGYEVVAEFTGRAMLESQLIYRHPLLEDRRCLLVGANYVTIEDGTGLVHTAPGHGTEDYFTGLSNGLKIYCPVLADGTFDETAPEFLRGVSVWDANAKIVEHLKGQGALLAAETVTHSYPHDWRSKTPTIFRATEQWFIGVDTPLARTGKPLREMALEACSTGADNDGVDFIPTWARNRINGMLESRPDWCISRQRAWGLPIPAFYNEAGEPLLTPASVRAVASIIAEKGSDAWFELSASELLDGYDPQKDPQIENAADFNTEKLTKGFDIFDVWFESGSSWFAVAMNRGLVDDIPVDLYLEATDQHRGWFQLSLLPALGAKGKAPYRTVLTHGWVVDEEGRTKMSKSLGNAMKVTEQLGKRGADILRLWIASQNYQDDIRCSEGMIAQAEDAYRKIRNTLRFCLGAIDDYEPAAHFVQPAEHSIDLWMRMELDELIHNVRKAYDSYEFHRASRLMQEFCTVQASNVYLSAVKDRLYCDAPDSPRRRATQSVIRKILIALVELLAPILPHTCEEAWSHIPHKGDDWPESVHLASLPDVDEHLLQMAEDVEPIAIDDGMPKGEQLRTGPALDWEKLIDIRGDALVRLEALRNSGVKNPLDAEVVFTVPGDDKPLRGFIEQYLPELEDMLGVGLARIEAGDVPGDKPLGIEVLDTREKYRRCERSWKRRPDVGYDADYPDLSARDAAVMRELGHRS